MKFWVLLRKELTEIIRDRRAVISTLVLPFVAIPFVLMAVGYFMNTSSKQVDTAEKPVAVQADFPEDDLISALKGTGLSVYRSQDPAEDVRQNLAVIGISGQKDDRGVLNITVFVDETNEISSRALSLFQSAVDSLRSQMVKDNMEQLGVPDWAWQPFNWEQENITPPDRLTGYILGLFLGYILVLLVFTGCMYPAMDLIAGEKERHTIELLLSAPVSRGVVLSAKISAVAIAGLVAAISNIISYILSFSVFASAIPEMSSLGSLLSVSPVGIAVAMASAVPLAVLAASVEVAIASWARSYREAQTYLTPLVLLVILPAVASMVPGADISMTRALIPVYNTAMVVRTGLMGNLGLDVFFASLLANLVYAGMAVGLAAKAFSRESIIKAG